MALSPVREPFSNNLSLGRNMAAGGQLFGHLVECHEGQSASCKLNLYYYTN